MRNRKSYMGLFAGTLLGVLCSQHATAQIVSRSAPNIKSMAGRAPNSTLSSGSTDISSNNATISSFSGVGALQQGGGGPVKRIVANSGARRRE
jgi:hypothetical protein